MTFGATFTRTESCVPSVQEMRYVLCVGTVAVVLPSGIEQAGAGLMEMVWDVIPAPETVQEPSRMPPALQATETDEPAVTRTGPSCPFTVMSARGAAEQLAAVTVTVADGDAVQEPPAPVQVTLYVCVADGETETDPEVAPPVENPEPVQLDAFEGVQDTVADPPATRLVGFAETEQVGPAGADMETLVHAPQLLLSSASATAPPPSAQRRA